MTATRILLLLLTLCSSGRACIPTETPDYIYDQEWLEQERERMATASVLLTTVMETTAPSTSPSSAAPTTTTTSEATTTTTSSSTTTTTSTTTTASPCLAMPTPWFYNADNNFCYFFSDGDEEDYLWQDGQDMCEGYGGNLVSIADQAENDFLTSLTVIPYVYWIGLMQPAMTTVLSFTRSWTDGTQYNYAVWSNWDSGPPALDYANDQCVYIDLTGGPANGKWKVLDCPPFERPFICKVMATPPG